MVTKPDMDVQDATGDLHGNLLRTITQLMQQQQQQPLQNQVNTLQQGLSDEFSSNLSGTYYSRFPLCHKNPDAKEQGYTRLKLDL